MFLFFLSIVQIAAYHKVKVNSFVLRLINIVYVNDEDYDDDDDDDGQYWI